MNRKPFPWCGFLSGLSDTVSTNARRTGLLRMRTDAAPECPNVAYRSRSSDGLNVTFGVCSVQNTKKKWRFEEALIKNWLAQFELN